MSIIAKKITASLIRARRITARLINSGSSLVCRNFSLFGGSSANAEFLTPVSIAGDFEIQVSYAWNAPGISGQQTLLSSSGSDFFISLRGSSASQANAITFKNSPDSSKTLANLLSGDSTRNTLILTRIGTTLTATVAGNTASISTGNATISLSFIGVKTSNFNSKFNGQIHDLKIWQGGDSTTGTAIVNMRMDETQLDANNKITYVNTAPGGVNALAENVVIEEVCSNGTDWIDTNLWIDGEPYND